MIIKIDHVALNSISLKEDTKKLKLLGYNHVFTEKNIINPKIKKDLIKQYNKFHDLALFNCKDNIPIELINNWNVNYKKGYITPIFENIFEDSTEIKKENFNNFKKIRIKYFDVPIFIKEKSNSVIRFNKIVINVNDVENSIKFWECLGFKLIQNEENYIIMKFESFIDSVRWIYLRKIKKSYKHYLDDKGFNCLALISNFAKKEREIIRAKGFKTTDIEEFKINNKILNIFFSIAPSGELIEIVSINNRN